MNSEPAVKVLESSIKDDHGDKIYSYKLMSYLPENDVKDFCMKTLKLSYYTSEMPNPFIGELIEFKNLTNLNSELPEMYSYVVRFAQTS